MEGKVRSNDMKVNCLIQAQMGAFTIQEFGLIQDTAKIFRNGLRIGRCLCEFLSLMKTGFSAVLGAVILSKCFRAKLWENSPYISRQLEKIGPSLSAAMVNAGLTTFSKIEETNAREIELILNRHPPFGNQIREAVIHLPKYELTVEQLPRYGPFTAEIVVKVNLKNLPQLLSKRTAPDQHYTTVVIGDADNNVLYLQKVSDTVLIKSKLWSKRVELSRASKGPEISVHLVSSDYVGLDIQQKFNVFYSGAANSDASNQSLTQNTKPATLKKEPREKREYGAVSQDSGNKRECNHFCKNKDLCAHDCCKTGVTIPKRRFANYEFSSYLNDLKTRSESVVQTPVKRLKMKMGGEEQTYRKIQKYAYQPKERMHIGQSYRGSYAEVPSTPYVETVDLTQDQELYDEYCNDVLEQRPHVYDTYHNAVSMAPSHVPTTSSSRRPPGPGPGPGWEPQRSRQSPLIPDISFDLGDEWDDFDEDNLIDASEALGGAPSVQYNKTGFVAPSVPCVSSSATPMRSTASRIKTETLSPLPVLQPQNRLTLDLNKKAPGQKQGTFVDQKPAETRSSQVPLSCFGFFSQMDSAAAAVNNNVKEEDAFIGIFDGIF
uniref:SEC63 domain-containing protein n=1 Tax=Knipowitschia caucasica TaxID=637954 RepID=A0AAV2JNQ8_KNICA